MVNYRIMNSQELRMLFPVLAARAEWMARVQSGECYFHKFQAKIYFVGSQAKILVF